jgi:predicted nucleic acid-binding protein
MSDGAIYKYPYLESSVFIALLKGEVVGGIDRGEIAQQILDDGAHKRWDIFTSAFSLAEVIKDKKRPLLTPEEEKKIADYFKHEYIKLVTLDREVGEKARSLARYFSLRPPDAVHLASAIRAKCDELLTWDTGNFPMNQTIEGVTLKTPYWFGQTTLSLDTAKKLLE